MSGLRHACCCLLLPGGGRLHHCWLERTRIRAPLPIHPGSARNAASNCSSTMARLAIAQERSSPELRAWVERATNAIHAYYGHFPVQHARITVERVNGSGVQWARTFAYSGAHVRVGVGNDTSASQFESDWMLTHEFVHLALPELADRARLAAGRRRDLRRADCSRPRRTAVSRARMGGVRAGNAEGLPGPKDRGLDSHVDLGHAPTGAARCSAWSPTSRSASAPTIASACSDALRAILEDGGTLDHRWHDSRCAAQRRPRNRAWPC